MNSLSRTSLVIPVTVIALLICACSLPGNPKSTQKEIFILQDEKISPRPGNLASRPCLSLRISQPESAPGLNTARMAYRNDPNRIDYFAYNEWVASPARMIASLMENRLDESGMFGSIVSGSSDIRADLRLDSHVLSLYQDFTGETSTVLLSVKVNLIAVSGRTLMNSEKFSYRVPANERNAESGADAANRAAGQFLDDLTRFVSAALEPVKCPR
jgi:cholesterol transport system auxiliary component